jgi:DNA-binding NarL/FixJ family response regulator
MISPDRTRVLIAEDHPLYRKGLRDLIASDPDLDLVAEVTDGETVVSAALEHQPDLILMDLQLPGQSGIVATRQIMSALPLTRILVITLFEDDDSVFSALRAGARGYVLKDADEQDLLRAMHAVAEGDSLFSPSIANRVLAFFAASRPVAPEIFPSLTERERDILTLLARGHSNPQIATELFLSPKTIANNLTNIFSKLQVADRSEAIIRARDAGLHSP